MGGFSPLTGFMGQEDYQVIKETRLANGLVWSVPITLPVSKVKADTFAIGQEIALHSEDGGVYGVLMLEEKYAYDKKQELS